MKYGVLDCFMAALLLGLASGPVYEALRIIRLIFRRKLCTFICDAAFFVYSAFAVTRFSLMLGDYVRYYIVLGFFAGVFCYITTVGRIANGIEQGFAIIFRKTVGRFVKFLKRKIRQGIGAFAQFVKSLFGTISDFFAKQSKSIKRHLISKRQLVYNNSYKEKLSHAHRENMQGSEGRNVIKANVTRGADKKAPHGSA